MWVRRATTADAAACAEIYRPYVLDTAITFETDVPTVAEFAERIAKALATHEFLVLEVDGCIAGYAYAQTFNPRAAYRWSVETSVYVAQDRRHTGGGRMLYTELLQRLAQRGFRRAFAGIAQPNEASNALHAAFGFRPAVTIGASAGNSARGTTSRGGSSTCWRPRTRSTRRVRSSVSARRTCTHCEKTA